MLSKDYYEGHDWNLDRNSDCYNTCKGGYCPAVCGAGGFCCSGNVAENGNCPDSAMDSFRRINPNPFGKHFCMTPSKKSCTYKRLYITVIQNTSSLNLHGPKIQWEMNAITIAERKVARVHPSVVKVLLSLVWRNVLMAIAVQKILLIVLNVHWAQCNLLSMMGSFAWLCKGWLQEFSKMLPLRVLFLNHFIFQHSRWKCCPNHQCSKKCKRTDLRPDWHVKCKDYPREAIYSENWILINYIFRPIWTPRIENVLGISAWPELSLDPRRMLLRPNFKLIDISRNYR